MEVAGSLCCIKKHQMDERANLINCLLFEYLWTLRGSKVSAWIVDLSDHTGRYLSSAFAEHLWHPRRPGRSDYSCCDANFIHLSQDAIQFCKKKVFYYAIPNIVEYLRPPRRPSFWKTILTNLPRGFKESLRGALIWCHSLHQFAYAKPASFFKILYQSTIASIPKNQ